MPKRVKGHCKQCGHNVGEEMLSNQKLCYTCAKQNMLRAFDAMWTLKRSLSEPR